MEEEDPINPSDDQEKYRLEHIKTPILQLTMFICITANFIMIIYSFFLTKRLFSFLKWNKQKVMLQTIIYISLGMIFRLIQ